MDRAPQQTRAATSDPVRSRRAGATGHGWRTDLALGALVLIWASNFSVVKYALDDFLPLAFNGLRFALASGFMYVFVRLSGGGTRIERRHWPAMIGLGVLGNVVYQICFIYGLDWTLAGNAALMLATVPVFITLLSVLLRHERVSRLAWVGVVLSVAGVALVVWGSARAVRFGPETVRGDLTMLAAAVAWASYTVGSTPLIRRYGSMSVTAVTMWIGALGLLAVSTPAFLGQDWADVGWPAWSGLVYSGIFAIGVAYLIWYFSVGRMGGTRTAVYTNMIPIVAILIAWLALGETPTWLQVLGAVGIVGGALAVRLGKIEKPPERLPAE